MPVRYLNTEARLVAEKKEKKSFKITLSGKYIVKFIFLKDLMAERERIIAITNQIIIIPEVILMISVFRYDEVRSQIDIDKLLNDEFISSTLLFSSAINTEEKTVVRAFERKIAGIPHSGIELTKKSPNIFLVKSGINNLDMSIINIIIS